MSFIRLIFGSMSAFTASVTLAVEILRYVRHRAESEKDAKEKIQNLKTAFRHADRSNDPSNVKNVVDQISLP